ncbi:hypothetical protein H5410_000207 [Solanum commersonii]|uniref:Uncharacterized protein n=1 Tax=Solanum commersonii TaxID=4109 RepID=A0A9J6AW53_SOLCO|nr:hypothetical protein H5410_000207 [Solanum commersonii]
MENSTAASDEPQKKRPHLNSVFSSPTMARHSKTSSDNKDCAVSETDLAAPESCMDPTPTITPSCVDRGATP